MTLEQINALPAEDRIKELKRRTAPLPCADALLADWDERRHSVFDKALRPNRRIQTKEAQIDERTGKIIEPARFETKPVNRIALPLEQDIVNIHTAFTVGQEPKLTLVNTDEQSAEAFEILKNILRTSKMKFQNKRLVRAWLAEQECAEYWYAVQDEGWWKRAANVFLRALGKEKPLPRHKLKSVVWSPFRGDKLYPYFDEYGDLIALSREYRAAKDNTNEFVEKFMCVDKTNVTIYADGRVERQYRHGFDKLPVIYMHRSEPLCLKIKPIRERLETLLSNFADCLDYNFAPKLVASGDVLGMENRGTGSEIIHLENQAQVSYLTWQQSPEMARMEFDNLTERAYSLTNTPRISFENLKGLGSAFSGVAFKFAFMGTHMAVSNHAEVVEEFLQRRINFLLSAAGTLCPKYKPVTDNMIVETEIVPYMIDNMAQNIDAAVRAVEGGVASRRTGIVLAGLTDRVQEELDEINEQETNKNRMDIFNPTG